MIFDGYDCVRLFNRNIAAVPAGDRTLYLELVKRLSENSWKKNTLKVLLSTITHLRLERFVSEFTKEIPFGSRGLSAHDLVTRLERKLGLSPLKALFFFPPQKDRGRCYFYLFNYDGACTGFGKVSLDTFNTNCLINEKHAMSFMKGTNVSFQIPSIICDEFSGEYNYIVYEPMDAGFSNQSFRWNSLPFQYRNEILGLVRPKKLNECDWWRELITIGPKRPDRFLASLMVEQTDTIFTGCAHGDLTNNNIFAKENEIFIIDWEYFSESAPYTVDEISFYLTEYQSFLLNDPYRAFKRIISSLCDGCSRELLPERVLNAKMAFGYLLIKGNQQSMTIASAWSEQYEHFLHGI